MPKPTINEDARVEALIERVLATGRELVFGGLDPSASGAVGTAKIIVEKLGKSRPWRCFPVRRAGVTYSAAVFEPGAEKGGDPWSIAANFLFGVDPASVILTSEDQFIGVNAGSGVKVIEARARQLYAFERQGVKTILRAAPSSWHSRVLGSKRWTTATVKPAAEKLATAMYCSPVTGDAADAVGVCAYTVSRFFTLDFGAFR